MAEATKTTEAADGTAARAEAIREAARDEAPKHRWLLRSARDGRVLSALMLPLLWAHAPAGFAVLTTTGRKSGKTRRKCVRAIRHGDRVYIVALRPPELAIERPTAVSAWVWNIRANPTARIHIGLRTHSGTAREIDDPIELERVREVICEPPRGRVRRMRPASARGSDARQDQGPPPLLVRHGHPHRRPAERLKRFCFSQRR
jgi:deazaflavin-dependent oxidoreductase (nitroreductase family)